MILDGQNLSLEYMRVMFREVSERHTCNFLSTA
jgi:hypothetical protein